MKLDKIAKILNNQEKDIPVVEINWLLTDSRSLSFPEQSLFFAIQTSRNDGHKYIPELYSRNMRYFVVNEMRADFDKLPEAVFLKVENTLHALQTLATARRELYSIPVIGITGSNGKTIVKEWLYQLLQNDYTITRSPRSYNSQTGVPLSVWNLSDQTTLGIFEAGISEPGEMKYLQKIIQPTLGIFTNIGDAHQENFLSIEQKIQEKLILFLDAEVLIYCQDDILLDRYVEKSGMKEKSFSWGKAENNQLIVLGIETQSMQTQIFMQYQKSRFDVVIPFTDKASVENVLHCITVMLYLKYETVEIKKRISRLEPVGMRLEIKEGIHNSLLINDSYNSDLDSLSIALDFQNQQATVKKLSKTLIISDISQSGFSSPELYKKVSELVNSKHIHKVIGIGEEIIKYSSSFKNTESYFFKNTQDFLKSVLIHDFHDELILLKGARRFHFEDISATIESIAHETVLEVNLNALIDNFNYFRSKLRPGVKIMSMVKAFAYGSGSVEIARILQHHHCDYLAVAVADEGAELRREGIRIPIVVMNPEKGGFGIIIDQKLEPEIYSFGLLKSFVEAAARLGITDYPIHIKIDSGMHRLGFLPEETDQLITFLKGQSQVKIRSIFSHLAGSDESGLDNFTKEQVETFVYASDKIKAAFSHHIMRHILNSAGIERFSEYQFDMVRLGIGHYGVSATHSAHLKQVCSLKTVILQIKSLKAGETVGYGRNGKITKNSRIAVLPIGYADGYDRKLGNGAGEVFINGKRAKVIGNISMDLCTVDVTDIDAEEGDSVEIFGENIAISEIADWLGTIPYEVLTSVSRRVKRVYFQE